MCSEGGALGDKARQEPREKGGPDGGSSLSVSCCQMPERLRERKAFWLAGVVLVSCASEPSRRTTD